MRKYLAYAMSANSPICSATTTHAMMRSLRWRQWMRSIARDPSELSTSVECSSWRCLTSLSRCAASSCTVSAPCAAEERRVEWVREVEKSEWWRCGLRGRAVVEEGGEGGG